MEVSWVIGLPPVIIHFWDFPVNKNQPAIGYPHLWNPRYICIYIYIQYISNISSISSHYYPIIVYIIHHMSLAGRHWGLGHQWDTTKCATSKSNRTARRAFVFAAEGVEDPNFDSTKHCRKRWLPMITSGLYKYINIWYIYTYTWYLYIYIYIWCVYIYIHYIWYIYIHM